MASSVHHAAMAAQGEQRAELERRAALLIEAAKAAAAVTELRRDLAEALARTAARQIFWVHAAPGHEGCCHGAQGAPATGSPSSRVTGTAKAVKASLWRPCTGPCQGWSRRSPGPNCTVF